MKELTLGIDLSMWQTNDANNPTRFFNPVVAKEKGIQFAFMKASERLGKDPAFETFAKTFSDAGIPFGCYHFARNSGSASAVAQADFFWKIIKDKGWELPPVLDLEDKTLISGNTLGMSWVKAWVDRILELSGRIPIIYTSPGYWNSIGKSNETVSKWAAECPLWLAHYFGSGMAFPIIGIPDKVATSTTLPAVPLLWKKFGDGWAFWQFTSGGHGEYYGGNYAYSVDEVGLDLNVYNGSLFDLYAEFGIGVEESPSPEEPPIVISSKVKTRPDMPADYLRFRNRPEIYPGHCLVIGRDITLDLILPEPVDGKDQNGEPMEFWAVRLDSFEGYISANPKYTVKV